MTIHALVEIIILIGLVALSGYFSSAETAFSTVNRVTLQTMADEGDSRAALVLKVISHYGKLLSTILICNNVVNISASALATSFVIRYFGSGFVSIATILLTVAVLLFGEITPKNISMLRALDRSMKAAPVFSFLMTVLTPVIFLVDKLSAGIMKLLGVDTDARQRITESELRSYVEAGREEGLIESDGKKMIYNVLDFGDTVAKDIMIPRIDMTCVDIDDSYEDVLATFRQDMFTRIPVYEKDPGNIVGIINIKDFILVDGASSFRLRSLLRPAFYTYEYKRTADLLREMQKKSQGVAFVLSEFGDTIGMITLEDIVEELVGEIRDEYDEGEKQQIRKYDDCTYLVEGSMKLDDINEAIGSDFDSEDYDSIGGLIIEQLDRLPRNDEVVTLPSGTSLQAKGIRDNRIVKVLIRFREAPKLEEEEEAEKDSNE